jgi:hypothetical protein
MIDRGYIPIIYLPVNPSLMSISERINVEKILSGKVITARVIPDMEWLKMMGREQNAKS